jgi:hypothetical protein
MPKENGDRRQAHEHSSSLDKRLARLRLRRRTLTRLIDSLTAYAQCARHESDLTYFCHLHHPSQVPDKYDLGNLGNAVPGE